PIVGDADVEATGDEPTPEAPESVPEQDETDSTPDPFADLDASAASDEAPERSKTGALDGLPPLPPLDAPAAPEAAADLPEDPSEADGDASSEPPEPGPDAAPEPLWARLARQRRQAAGEREPDAPEVAETGGTPLWKQFASGGAAAGEPAATLADSIFSGDEPAETLRDTIADAPPVEIRPEDHEAIVLGDAVENGPWYVETLFDGDEEAYAEVLAQLVDAASWTEATQIIGREVFRRYKVNIYSEPAVSFTGAVEARYQRG
ncbi:MAG: hypothetical protein AAFQ43_00720, partial [Bacteroidota bacterium]